MRNFKTALILLYPLFIVSCSDSNDHSSNEVGSTIVSEDHPAVAHLNRIVIPKVNISDTTPEEAFDYVRHSLVTHDNESEANHRGVSMIIRGPRRQGNIDEENDLGLASDSEDKRITYSGENVAIFELIKEVARQSQMDAYLTSVGFMIIPEGALPFPNDKTSEGEIITVIRQTKKP